MRCIYMNQQHTVFKSILAGVLSSLVSVSAIAADVEIGTVEKNGMEIVAVYIQPVTMEPMVRGNINFVITLTPLPITVFTVTQIKKPVLANGGCHSIWNGILYTSELVKKAITRFIESVSCGYTLPAINSSCLRMIKKV